MDASPRRLRFESFGVTAEVISDDRALFELLPAVLPPGWRARPTAVTTVTFGLMGDGSITLDGGLVGHAPEGQAALAMFGSAVRHHVAQHAGPHIFVHAGVVSVGGVGIVIPGRSFSGKTTLVRELIRAGGIYYSDEYAAVDEAGMIHAYAKPLTVRGDGEGGLGVAVAVPEALTGVEPIRAGLVVVTNFAKGAVWRPEPLGPAEGALAILSHTVAARSRPRHALLTARRVAQNARFLAGPRGEARAVARAIVDAATEAAHD